MGLADLFKKGLEKTRNFFAESFTKLAASSGHFNEDMLDDLEELLIRADCGVQASEDIMDHVKNNIKKTGNDSEEAVLGSVKERMLEILGERETLEIVPGKLNIILMIGVNGTGKTTTSGKLSARYKKEGKRVLMAACDTFRAAAVEQICIWGERVGVPVIKQQMGSDPASVAFDTLSSAKANGADVVLIDTAGRLHNKVGLMNELKKIKEVMKKVLPEAPDEVMLVLDGSTGQNAFEQAKQFAAVTQITSLAITKLDGTAKGGVVIGISDQLKVPVKYIGLGEGMEDLQLFNKRQFVDSLFSK